MYRICHIVCERTQSQTHENNTPHIPTHTYVYYMCIVCERIQTICHIVCERTQSHTHAHNTPHIPTHTYVYYMCIVCERMYRICHIVCVRTHSHTHNVYCAFSLVCVCETRVSDTMWHMVHSLVCVTHTMAYCAFSLVCVRHTQHGCMCGMCVCIIGV